jgi:hypothetical protein
MGGSGDRGGKRVQARTTQAEACMGVAVRAGMPEPALQRQTELKNRTKLPVFPTSIHIRNSVSWPKNIKYHHKSSLP